MSDADWNPVTRLMHWALAITLTFQLFSGLFVASPQTRLYFHLHEAVGLIAGVVILMEWMWIYTDREGRILFPWSRVGLARVGSELAGLLRGQLPERGRRVGLSGFVHGLGLLAMTGMAVTGVLIFVVVPAGHTGSTDYGSFTALSLLHRFLAQFAWAYWIGHVVFAVLHQVRGSNVFGAIFLRPHNPA